MKNEFIPKTPEPKDYLTGYARRMEKNDWELHQLAQEVIKADPEVEVYFHHDENRYQNGVKFFKGEMINGIQFSEVPYRWSGCGVSNHGGIESDYGGLSTCSMSFDVNDVLTTFHPITDVLHRQPNEYFKSKEQFLKWSSYLKKWEI